jgi:hypothetical protein
VSEYKEKGRRTTRDVPPECRRSVTTRPERERIICRLRKNRRSDPKTQPPSSPWSRLSTGVVASEAVTLKTPIKLRYVPDSDMSGLRYRSDMSTQSLTQKWLRQNTAPYLHTDRVYADVDATLARFPTLAPRSDIYSSVICTLVVHQSHSSWPISPRRRPDPATSVCVWSVTHIFSAIRIQHPCRYLGHKRISILTAHRLCRPYK